MAKRLPNLSYERKFWRQGYWVVGVDEVGRGALAGPVFVAAVCFCPDYKTRCREAQVRGEFFPNSSAFLKSSKRIFLGEDIEKLGIDDSKKLSPKKREELAKIIKKNALFVTASSSVAEINRFGIVKATEKAIRKAVREIKEKLINTTKIYLLLDAFYVRYVKGVRLVNQLAIIKGDQKSLSIAAASIIAKVTRDSLMKKLAKKYFQYHWRENKGYGTFKHVQALKKYGKTKFHRKLFLRRLLPRPVSKLIG